MYLYVRATNTMMAAAWPMQNSGLLISATAVAGPFADPTGSFRYFGEIESTLPGMRYGDPAGLFSFRYPMGWVYAPERSATGAVVFEHFVPEQAILRVVSNR